MITRTHLKNSPDRAASQFRLARGARTKSYSKSTSSLQRQGVGRNWLHPSEFSLFSHFASFILVGVASGYTFLVAPRETEKIVENAVRTIS